MVIIVSHHAPAGLLQASKYFPYKIQLYFFQSSKTSSYYKLQQNNYDKYHNKTPFNKTLSPSSIYLSPESQWNVPNLCDRAILNLIFIKFDFFSVLPVNLFPNILQYNFPLNFPVPMSTKVFGRWSENIRCSYAQEECKYKTQTLKSRLSDSPKAIYHCD